MSARKRTAWIGATVIVEINDEDVIERVTGSGGDEWRASFYDLRSEKDVIQHLAFNCVANGVESVKRLDGWADLPDEAAVMCVERDTLDVDVQPESEGGER